MAIELFKTAWGVVGQGKRYETLADFVSSAFDEGYRGVEFPVFYVDAERAIREHIEELSLDYVALIAT